MIFLLSSAFTVRTASARATTRATRIATSAHRLGLGISRNDAGTGISTAAVIAARTILHPATLARCDDTGAALPTFTAVATGAVHLMA